MAEYEVTIVRMITTTVRVDAEEAAKARRHVEEYGIAEAWADFDHSDKSDTFRIKSVASA